MSSSQKLTTPVVLTIFTRLEIAARVLDAIKQAQPPRLYVIADEGRTYEEREKIEKVKELISQVDWCEVRTNYAEKNMGPKMRLATGISWVFEHEERAIILEHDCLPHPSFFSFCEELLERYKDDERVMHIGGNNFFKAMSVDYSCRDSYFYTRIPHIWGWASWRRAWQHYDVRVTKWPDAHERRILDNLFSDPAAAFRWANRFEQYYEGIVESWDGQWSFAILSQGGLCINPSINLVTNIGFGSEAFTTKDSESVYSNIPTERIEFPLRHPSFMLVDELADALTQRKVFHINETLIQRIKWSIKSRFPSAYVKLKNVSRRPKDILS